MQVFGVFLLIEHLHGRSLGEQGRTGGRIVEGEQRTGRRQGEHTGTLHTHVTVLGANGHGGKLQMRNRLIPGGNHASNGLPISRRIGNAHAPNLEFINIDGDAIRFVGVIRLGDEARLTVPDAFTVDVQFLKNLEGFRFIVIVGDNFDATAITECVVDH